MVFSFQFVLAFTLISKVMKGYVLFWALPFLEASRAAKFLVHISNIILAGGTLGPSNFVCFGNACLLHLSSLCHAVSLGLPCKLFALSIPQRSWRFINGMSFTKSIVVQYFFLLGLHG